MARLNKKKPSVKAKMTTNIEGGLAFKLSPKMELVLRSASCLVNEPKFYVQKSDNEKAIRNLIKKVSSNDPDFVWKLAKYLRSKMYLRTLPQFMMVEALQYPNCKLYGRRYIPQIISRADDLLEAVAYFIAKNGKIGTEGEASLPHCFKDGLEEALRKFNAYQIAKYNNKRREVTFKDILRLLHPRPSNSRERTLFKDIINDTLPIPDTWETYISANGSSKKSWEAIIPSMGYMAKLRNLRNFLKHGVRESIMESVLKELTSVTNVKKSKQFPFRFYSAYKVISESSEGDPFIRRSVLKALNRALSASVSNIPTIHGRTAIFIDLSGSMTSRKISGRSDIRPIDIAGVMGSLSHHICSNAIVIVFGSRMQVIDVSSKGILDGAREIISTDVGGCTYAYKPMRYLVEKSIRTNRILLFSDEQCYNDTFNHADTLYYQFKRYKRKYPNAILHSVDLCGYGSSQFPEMRGVSLIGGWSDRILQYFSVYEEIMSNNIILKAIEEQ